MDNRTKALFISLTFLFVILLTLRVISFIDHGSFSFSKIFPHVFMIVILNQRNSITWALGVIFFLYGLYYYLFIPARIAYPSEIEFTLPIVELFFGSKHGFSNARLIVALILWAPLFFYLAMIVCFFTRRIRKIYSSFNIFS